MTEVVEPEEEEEVFMVIIIRKASVHFVANAGLLNGTSTYQ
jgi:hypothetical protein